VNIWTVKRGKAAATAERMMVFAANADALYILKNIVRRETERQINDVNSQIGIDEVALEGKIGKLE